MDKIQQLKTDIESNIFEIPDGIDTLIEQIKNLTRNENPVNVMTKNKQEVLQLKQLYFDTMIEY